MRTIILSFFLIPFFLFAAEVKSYDFVVAKDGTGNFTTIQDAIDAVPDFRKKETEIYTKVIFMHCNLPKFIEDKGWHNWGKESNEKTAYFAEYKNKGAGSMSQNRVKWSCLLTDREADSLNFQRVFKDWVPNLTFDR